MNYTHALPNHPYSVEDLQYAAGYLDGEGYVSERDLEGPEVKVDAVNPRPLEKLFESFGGSIRSYVRPGRSRRYWRWRLCGNKARELCLLLQPFLTVKREEALAVGLSGMLGRGTAMRMHVRSVAEQCRAAEFERVPEQTQAVNCG